MFDSEAVSSLVIPDTREKRRTYDGLFKAQVVCEWINGKRSLPELADKYHLHPNQIKNWKMTLLKRASHVLDDRRRSGSHHPPALGEGIEEQR